jgi:hypothetical protein
VTMTKTDLTTGRERKWIGQLRRGRIASNVERLSLLLSLSAKIHGSSLVSKRREIRRQVRVANCQTNHWSSVSQSESFWKSSSTTAMLF